MEENEALLEKDNKQRLKSTFKTYSYEKNKFCDSPDSSADESVGWWAEESHSSCNTSCSGPDSVLSANWKSEIDANGELFYIESQAFEEITNEGLNNRKCQVLKEDSTCKNTGNSRKGKFKDWIKRKHGKRRRAKLPVESDLLPSVTVRDEAKTITTPEYLDDDVPVPVPVPATATATATAADTDNVPVNQQLKEIFLRLDVLGEGTDVIEKILGLRTFYSSESQRFFITGFTNDGPLNGFKDVNIGDVLLCVNNERLTPQNIQRLLEALKFPVEVILTIEKNSNPGKKKSQSALVRSLLNKNEEIETVLKNQAVGVVFVHLKNEYVNQKELMFSFPSESLLSHSLGSFVTLYHLLPDLVSKNECCSSSAYFKDRLMHVYYIPEADYLLLIAVPGSRCTNHEASYIIDDLVRCLLFSHQTLYRCFKSGSVSNLNHFFSVFFFRLLTLGFSGNATRNVELQKVSSEGTSTPSQFEDLLQCVESLPLPKEVQMQLDDSLSEMEANYDSEEDVDFNEYYASDGDSDDCDDYDDDDVSEDEGDFVDKNEECKRRRIEKEYIAIGSCMYHKGYLLASHFSKDNLLNVHSFFRQNGLIQLFRSEPVESLVIWREVHPRSTDEEYLKNEFCLMPDSPVRWFLMIIGQGYDALAFILKLHGYSGKLNKHLHSMISFIENGEEKLRRLRKLGVSKVASRWLSDHAHSKTITTEEYLSLKKNKKTETMLDIIKAADDTQKSLVSESPPLPELKQSAENVSAVKNRKIFYADTSEDSASQAPSNQSEISDENAPILGRRAERSTILPELASDESDNSDSDWESFQDIAQHDHVNGIFPDSRILKNHPFTRARLTTGSENSLFHFVHFNECEGILIAPTVFEETSPKTGRMIENFRRAAQLIHSVLDNNVRFKKSNEDGSRSYINKSLVAVKEHGLLLMGSVKETEYSTSKKNCSPSYWVIGRLFFTPHRREVYVCHSDDAPQNLVDIGFRLGLSIAE